MLITTLKKLFVKSSRRKVGSSYLSADFSSCNIPGKKRQSSDDKTSILRLQQWLASRKRKKENGYRGSRPHSRQFLRFGGLFFVGCCLLLFFVAGGGAGLQKKLQSLSFFKVNEVVLSGGSIVSQVAVRNAAAIVLHQRSLIGLDCAAIEKRIGAVDWVSTAKVTRNWPSTIEITVKEDVPVALLHIKGAREATELYYIDRKGKVFLPVEPGDDIDFPVITGWFDIKNSETKEQALSEVLIFLRKLRVNNPHLPTQSVSEIHVNQNGEMVVYLVEYPFPIFFGNGNTKTKYARLVQVLKALYKKKRGKELISRVEYIQMNYLNDKVLVAQSGSG